MPESGGFVYPGWVAMDMERWLEAYVPIAVAMNAPPLVRGEREEQAADAESAGRVTSTLRREQHARDGRPVARAWTRMADAVERSHLAP